MKITINLARYLVFLTILLLAFCEANENNLIEFKRKYFNFKDGVVVLNKSNFDS